MDWHRSLKILFCRFSKKLSYSHFFCHLDVIDDTKLRIGMTFS